MPPAPSAAGRLPCGSQMPPGPSPILRFPPQTLGFPWVWAEAACSRCPRALLAVRTDPGSGVILGSLGIGLVSCVAMTCQLGLNTL